MKIDLVNKTILITGSSDGIGKMLAIELSKLGANIILLGRNQKKLNNVYDQLNTSTSLQKHLIIETDLNTLNNITAHEIFIAINQEFNDLDGLINNAAILGTMTPLRDYDMSIWDQVIQTNLTAPFLLTKALLPMLATSSLPRIIFTSSEVANIG